MTQPSHNTPSADTLEEVRAFLAQELRESPDRIQPNTRLEDDLDVTGDDAAELLEAFVERFGVNMEGLDFHRHFGPEGCNPLWLLLTPHWFNQEKTIPVTVAHLARVAAVKHWFSP